MKQRRTLIGEIPAIIYGEESDQVYLYVHGQGGHKEEAERFAPIVSERGWQVLSIDLPGHGERKSETDRFYPWVAVPEIQSVWSYLDLHWRRMALRADSIGAWFSMLALRDEVVAKSLFVSPILDMEHLIDHFMQWAGVTSEELETRKTIPTSFGQTLSWDYLVYAQEHPIAEWNSDTRVLYGSKDNLTERYVVDAFVERFHCGLTVMEGGEHWFHTEEQLAVLDGWVRDNS